MLIPTDPSNGTIVPLIPTTGIGTGLVKPSSSWRFPAVPTVPAEIVKLKDVAPHTVDWNSLAVDIMTALKPIFLAGDQQASASKFLCYGRAVPVTTGLLETSWSKEEVSLKANVPSAIPDRRSVWIYAGLLESRMLKPQNEVAHRKDAFQGLGQVNRF